MIESIPVPLQAILWPLVGAAIVLVAGRYLPNWMRRLLAAAAATASWLALWQLRTDDVERIAFSWEPLNLFRLSPLLAASGPALLVGLTLAGVTAICVLAIRGYEPRTSTWHGLALIALSGSLVVAMAGNLLTLALGSALIDLALIAFALSAAEPSDRTAWRMAVPGVFSTLLLLFGALLMDVRLGHATLWTSSFPAEVLVLLGLAGLLRLLVYPLYPRGLDRPEAAAILLLPLGTGIYLLSQLQAATPLTFGSPWALAIGCAALLAGSFLAWTRGLHPAGTDDRKENRPGPDWIGIAVQQTGYALAFIALAGATPPWPLLSLTLALGGLAILWEVSLDSRTRGAFSWPEWLTQWIVTWRDQAQAFLQERAPTVNRLGEWVAKHGMAVLLAVVLASLAGIPLTAGAVGRWSLYALLLQEGTSAALLMALIADTMLVASLGVALVHAFRQPARHRPTPAALIAIVALNLLLIVLGIAPNALFQNIGMAPMEPPNVSVWGLGLIYVLPWLLGAWLARVSSRLETYSIPARRIVGLDWLFHGADWIGKRLAHAVGWLGLVGEGEGWWGWALVILALGTILFSLR